MVNRIKGLVHNESRRWDIWKKRFLEAVHNCGGVGGKPGPCPVGEHKEQPTTDSLFGQPVNDTAKGLAGFKVLSKLEAGEGSKESINPLLLIPTEKGSNSAKARSIADKWDKSKASVKVFEVGGKHYIFDGHHTVAAAIMQGETSIPIKVIKVEKRPW